MADDIGGSERVFDLVIAAVYVLALGAQVAWIADEATGGGVRRGWAKLVGNLKDGWGREREIQAEAGRVIWDAMEIAREAADQ